MVKCIVEDRVGLGMSNGIHLQGLSFKRQSATYFYSNFVGSGEQARSVGLSDSFVGENSALQEPADFQAITTTTAVIPDDNISVYDSSNKDIDSLSGLTSNVKDIYAGINESVSASVSQGENALERSLDTINSSMKSAFEGANEAVDRALSKVLSTVEQAGESVGSKLTAFSGDSKDASSKAEIIAVDALRKVLVAAEDSLTQGATLVVYAYKYTKDLLPPEIQNVLNSSEVTAAKILSPVGTTFQQVYNALEGLERSVGLDPNDPFVPFILALGTLATLWGSYWVLTYAGYAGDLSPKLTFELLTGNESAVLIDVRPEDFRERDGIPDLRRTARSRYAYVTLPEVDGSVRKLLKGGKSLDDSLIAAVIRNLKIVQDRSKVIVMDADGTRSKGIARSLNKLGVKKPYLVQGGFRSWVKEGLRIKELKPETTLTILSEEAEAILEDINPTPIKVIGYGVGLIAAAYALSEWEKTLQLVGVVGLGQTIYRRLASYEDSEDFRQDVSLLLAPVKMGGQAISWAAGKLETNRNGLPTSPSSSDVQSRVLQAAAKHESQPSDSEELQESPPDPVAPSKNQNVDLSEA